MGRKPDSRESESWAYLAPSDLRQHDLPSQAALGFHRGAAEELLARAADTIERLNRDVAELRQARETWKRERERLESRLEEAKTQAELLVGEAMLDAHKASQALRAEAETDAQAIRSEAEGLLEPAKEEAQRLVAEAQAEARRLIEDAEAERRRLAAEAEQYKLLAADVQRRSVDFLQRGLDALGADPVVSEAAEEDVRPFRSTNREAAGG
jgi:cell division septum initiation protein DivIVA